MCHFVTQDVAGQQLWMAWPMYFGTIVLWVQKRNHEEKPGACAHILGYWGSTSALDSGQKGFLCSEKVLAPSHQWATGSQSPDERDAWSPRLIRSTPGHS